MTENLSNDEGPGRLLAVGDIHGCLAPLQRLMSQVMPTPDDRIVFLGDYIDRGPDSAGVIDYLLDLAGQGPESIFLRGNHEQMFLDYLDGADPSLFLVNGGLMTLNSYRAAGRWPLPAEHRSFLDSTHQYFATESFIFVHAGLRPGVALRDQKTSDTLWIRGEFLASDYDWGKTIVFGHTPQEQPLISAHRLGLDTGCVYGRQLTCCDVRSGQIWQA
ncbi:MAG: metallophosphoesterase family protein [Desulfuromonadales bacterium]|jgi:serine/threonine protein phosphatase 1